MICKRPHIMPFAHVFIYIYIYTYTIYTYIQSHIYVYKVSYYRSSLALQWPVTDWALTTIIANDEQDILYICLHWHHCGGTFECSFQVVSWRYISIQDTWCKRSDSRLVYSQTYPWGSQLRTNSKFNLGYVVNKISQMANYYWFGKWLGAERQQTVPWTSDESDQWCHIISLKVTISVMRCTFRINQLSPSLFETFRVMLVHYTLQR